MSWFDDPDFEAALKGLSLDSSLSPAHNDYGGPLVGEILASHYIIQEILSPRRLVVRHHRRNQQFFARLSPKLVPGLDEYAHLESVTKLAGLLSNEQLGFVVEFDVCPRFGGFAICEHIAGTSLADMFQSSTGRRLSLDDVLRLVLDLGGILADLHDIGISHGLLDAADIIQDLNRRWHLMAPGVPAETMDIGPAPQVSAQLDSTPWSDQWSLGFITYKVLVGKPPAQPPLPPSSLRDDLPIGLDSVILRALDPQVSNRWRTIQQFVEAFQATIEQSRAPLCDPSEAISADALFLSEVDVEGAAAQSFSRLESRSVVTKVVLSNNPRIRVSFQNIERLRTEVRRNIIAAGLFAPGVTGVAKGTQVEVEVIYQPTGTHIVVAGMVAQVTDSGVGVLFDAAAHAALMAFAREVDPATDLKPQDRLTTAITLDKDSQVTAAEAFLLSRLVGTVELGQLRGFFNGLPFNFDETVVALIERGFIRVDRTLAQATPRKSLRAQTPPVLAQPVHLSPVKTEEPGVAPSRPVAKRPPEALTDPVDKRVELSRDEIDIVLDKATVFEGRGNYRAAIEVCQNALTVRVDGRLLHRLAILRARFQTAYGRALRDLEKAASLRPDDQGILETQRWLQALIDTEAVQKVWRYDVGTTGRYRMVRVDPDIRRIWIEIDAVSPPERRVLGVDVMRGRLVSTVRSNDPRNESTIPGNHFRLAPLEAKVSSSITLRSRRAKLAEMAKTSDDYGPWMRRGPAPIACAPNSNFMVFQRHPDTQVEGLYIVQEGTTMSPLKLERDGTRGVRPTIAPDNSGAVAFSTTGPINAVWVAELFQAPREILTVTGESSAQWSSNGQSLYTLDHRTGRMQSVGRRGRDPKIIAEVGPCTSWFVDPEHHSAVCVALGERKLTWVSFEHGVKNEVEISERVTNGLLREDGVAALLTAKGLWLVDFNNRRKSFVSISVHPSSFENNAWMPKQSLVVLSGLPAVVEVCTIDPGMLL